MFFAKYAILRQIESMFFLHRRTNYTYKMILVLIWANFASYLGTTLAYLLACIPREKIWNPTVNGRCLNQRNVIVSTPALNLISDVMILIVPVVEVFKLQMPLRRKLSVAAIFGVGVLSLVASIARLYYSVLLKQSEDLTGHLAPVGLWAIGELTTVILIACFPYVPPLVRLHRRSTENSSYQLPNIGRSTASRQRARQYGDSTLDDSSSVKALHDQSKGPCVDIETIPFP
ncbi:hypothetical protein F4679DRAFT_555047 [Xylaria curta]|nr:hypothetical protein F4679DRAFT_555047 [Xylaria curta]